MASLDSTNQTKAKKKKVPKKVSTNLNTITPPTFKNKTSVIES